MSKNNGFTGVFDPSRIVQMQQGLPYRGYPTSPGYQKALGEKLFAIYEKNGQHYPVTHVIDNTQPNLDISPRLASVMLPNMQGAHHYRDVSLGEFNKTWDHKDDAALGNRHEAVEKINQVLPRLVSGSPDGVALRGSTKPYV